MGLGSILKKGTVAIYVVVLLIGALLIFILPPIGFIVILLCAVLLTLYAVLAGAGKRARLKPEQENTEQVNSRDGPRRR